MTEITLRRKRNCARSWAIRNFARKFVPGRCPGNVVSQSGGGTSLYFAAVAAVAQLQNANDHESEWCAYIRRHPLKIVVATASAPCGTMLA